MANRNRDNRPGGGSGQQKPQVEFTIRLAGKRDTVSGSISLMKGGQPLKDHKVELVFGDAGNPRIAVYLDPSTGQPKEFIITAAGVAPINLDLSDPTYKEYTTLSGSTVLDGNPRFTEPHAIPEEINLPGAKLKPKRVEVCEPENENPTTEWWSRDLKSRDINYKLRQENIRMIASCNVTVKDAITEEILEGGLNNAPKRASHVRILDFDTGIQGMRHLLIYPDGLECTIRFVHIETGEEATTTITCG